jgi:nucleotide-binding universal stress UspA family protein
MDARDGLRALIPAGLGNRVHVHVRVGPVVKVILDYAAQIEARLIVMGITRKSILRNLFAGTPPAACCEAARARSGSCRDPDLRLRRL